MTSVAEAFTVLTVVSLVTRITPLFFGKVLQRQRWIGPIADQLPCLILILLVVHDLETRANTGTGPAAAVGIVATLLTYRLSGQLLAALTAGVVVFASITHLI